MARCLVLGEKPEEKMRQLMTAKAKEKKQEEIIVVRYFLKVNSKNSKTRVSFDQAHRLGEHRCENYSLLGYYHRFIEKFSKIAKPLTILTWKCKTFAWGKEQENAFQTLKDKLCNAPVLALPDGLEDFVIELFSDYDCEIRYHPGKANVVVDALSRKERVNPKRVRVMNMTLQSSIKDRILASQKEAFDESTEL
ncbi:hypothetical protein Tco_0212255 [Tanacetum coccineum]